MNETKTMAMSETTVKRKGVPSDAALFDRSGWKTMPFGAFADCISERAHPVEFADAIYVGLEHLDPENLHIKRWGKGSDVEGVKLRFYKGDIIFGRRRAYQRKLAVAEVDGICSAHAMVVRAKPKVCLPEFLPFLMMSDAFMKRAVEISVGSLSPTISWKVLKEQTFALPPLDQQRRIAELLWAVDAHHQALIQMHEACGLSQKREAEHSMFGEDQVGFAPFSSVDRYRPPAGWQLVAMNTLLSAPITRGYTPSEYLNTATARIPFVKVTHLSDDGVLQLEKDPFHLERAVHEGQLNRSRVFPGDVLVSLIGPPLGKHALVPDTVIEANINQAIAIYRFDDDILRRYVLHYLRTEHALTWLRNHSKKTSGQQNLTLQVVGALPIPLPPRKRLESLIERLKLYGDSLRATDQHIRATEELRASILMAVCN